MKIGLGAVQFGLNYGISNYQGKTLPSEVGSILVAAQELGVRVIDTASLYGESEEVLGRCMPQGALFDIVTKTPQFGKSELCEADAQHLQDVFETSLAKLGYASVYGLLIHKADDLLVPGGSLLMDRLVQLKQAGLVNKIGVSVYTERQIDDVLARFSVDLVQLPVSILDQRLINSGHLQKLKQAGVEIHARSVFLQGLLLMRPDEVPAYFDSVRGELAVYHQFIASRGLTPVQAALGFVTAIDEIDCVICGVNSRQQLEEICMAADTPVGIADFANFSVTDESIVNPARWRISKG